MTLYRRYLLILMNFPLMLHGQQVDSMLKVYAIHYPQEKIHVQMDKKIYRPGETIWFKAYIFSGAEPSLMSRNFYAELSDASGSILQRNIYPVTESSTAGSFYVQENLRSRYLHIRAYTTWMTNFDTAFYFGKDIRIYDPQRDSADVVPVVRAETKIQFFPEGGDLVAGIESAVAFKANDQFGQPVAVVGAVQDRTGKELVGQ